MSDEEFERKSYNRVLRQVCEDEGLKNVALEISVGSSKGDNYMGRLYRVKAHGQRGPNHVTLHLVLKTSANDGLRGKIPTDLWYKRESFAYQTVLRELLNQQEEAAVDPGLKYVTVKCYHASDEYLEEMLVLEDLSVQGFVMYDRLKSLDYSHTSLAMSSLGKMHALSYVMKAKKPLLFKQISSKCPDIFFQETFAKAVGDIFPTTAKLCLTVIEDPENKERVENFSKIITERMRALTKAEKYAVLGHGDFWGNNMLFKYDTKGVPSDIRFLDFQLMRYCSPALDIFNLMFCSTDQEFRSKHYHFMLDLYHHTLSACLREHSLDVDDFMSKKDFLREMKDMADFGLGMAMHMARFVTSDTEDVPDIFDFWTKRHITRPTGEALKRFQNRVNGMIKDFVEYGYLD